MEPHVATDVYGYADYYDEAVELVRDANQHEEEEEEICLFNIVCSYTNSAM